MKRYCKLIISTITIALIFTIVLSPCSFAMRPQQFSAWVASALTALNITVGSTLVPAAQLGERINEFFSWPVKVESGQLVDVPYTFTDSDIEEYLSRSVLKVDKDKVTIDGVEYTDVWLSTDAAEKFRVNAFDIENAWDIASNTEGTFVTGAGTCAGVPVFSDGNSFRSQTIKVPAAVGNYGVGDIDFIVEDWDQAYPFHSTSYYNNQEMTSNTVSRSGVANGFTYWITPQTANHQLVDNGYGTLHGVGYQTRTGTMQHSVDATPFDFDWVSGTIPADEHLVDEGLRIRVPTSDIDDWYQDYPDTGPNVTINMGDPELTQKVDDLIDLIIPLIPVLDIDFVDYQNPPVPEPIPDPEPYPDPAPEPGTVISDTDWYDIFETIKNIFDQVSIGNSITSAIKNLLDKVKWGLDDIVEKIGDLPDAFERHIINTWRKALDVLKGLFAPILLLLKNAIGIWHHVVYWISYIAGPFWWLMNIITQGYPGIMYPIYASIAGFIVIAVYRRIGR